MSYQKKRDEWIKIRATNSEKLELERRAVRRGLSQSEYAREKIFSDENTNLYNTEVKNLLLEISSNLYYEVEKYCENEDFIKKSKEAAIKLWHCLK